MGLASPKICKLADPMLLTLELLNLKLTGLDTLSRTTTVPGFKSFQSGFSFYCAKLQTYTPTHHDLVITISVPPYYVVGVDNKN